MGLPCTLESIYTYTTLRLYVCILRSVMESKVQVGVNARLCRMAATQQRVSAKAELQTTRASSWQWTWIAAAAAGAVAIVAVAYWRSGAGAASAAPISNALAAATAPTKTVAETLSMSDIRAFAYS